MGAKYYPNESVRRVLLGVPKGHKHLRLIIEFSDGETLILSEATLANIVRAYVTVKTHPSISAVELRCSRVERRKEGYAEYQLLEVERDQKEIEEEILGILESSQVSGSISTPVP